MIGDVRPSAGDLVAGISVALVLIPQALAYAELAGLPPHVGLLAAALSPIVAAIFASSPYLQTGPTAMTALLTFGVLSGVTSSSSSELVRLAALLALMVGTARLVMGVMRLGGIAYLMSDSVLLGFTTGAAVLIVASQIPKALDVAARSEGVVQDAWWALGHPGQWQPIALLLSVVTIAVMNLGPRVHRLFPGVLIVVVVSTARQPLCRRPRQCHRSDTGRLRVAVARPSLGRGRRAAARSRDHRRGRLRGTGVDRTEPCRDSSTPMELES